VLISPQLLLYLPPPPLLLLLLLLHNCPSAGEMDAELSTQQMPTQHYSLGDAA
jgi:hypothetical protein